MNIHRLFFGFKGRIGRLSWWAGMLTSALAFILAHFITTRLLQPSAYGLVGVIFSLGVLYMILALIAKRLHDRNRSGLWAILFYIVPKALDSIAETLERFEVTNEGSLVQWVLLISAAALGLWGLVELGVLKGTQGPNDYGPDPLTTSSADVPLEDRI
jgi:uncharacterized membrane protein YhaH (DUF805 family)